MKNFCITIDTKNRDEATTLHIILNKTDLHSTVDKTQVILNFIEDDFDPEYGEPVEYWMNMFNEAIQKWIRRPVLGC